MAFLEARYAWSGDNKDDYKQVIQWHDFFGGNFFCVKVCDPAGPDAAHFCEHIYDCIGCTYDAPNNAKNGTFESFQGDNQDFPGIYTDASGQVQTYLNQGTLNTILLAHVDDFTITAISPALIKATKDGLRKHLEIHDMVEIHWMLGLEIKRNRELRTLSISQRSYIDSIVTRYGFEDAKPLSIPIVANSTLSRKADGRL